MIEFFSDTEFSFPDSDAALIIPVINKMFSDYERKLNSLNVVFLNDEQLLDINKEFLNHDYYTDIITFNYADNKDEIEGELYISIDRVKENAVVVDSGFENELFRIIIHGCLHLCGLNDSTESEKKSMQLIENEYLNHIVSRETM